jgi:hypothetical protein
VSNLLSEGTDIPDNVQQRLGHLTASNHALICDQLHRSPPGGAPAELALISGRL